MKNVTVCLCLLALVGCLKTSSVSAASIREVRTSTDHYFTVDFDETEAKVLASRIGVRSEILSDQVNLLFGRFGQEGYLTAAIRGSYSGSGSALFTYTAKAMIRVVSQTSIVEGVFTTMLTPAASLTLSKAIGRKILRSGPYAAECVGPQMCYLNLQIGY